MQNCIPEFLYNRLAKQYNEEEIKAIIDGYLSKRPVTLRTNTLKSNVEKIKEELNKADIKFKEVEWYSDALILIDVDESKVRKLDIYKNGEIYLQSLSSMIPAIILNPLEGENILDMAAAPGGKTTQMSALSANKVLITACEKNKIRADRLRYNIEKQGASRINVLEEDARKLNELFSFDKILLDSPCSGSGTLNIEDERLKLYFTEELIERSAKIQYTLLKKAVNILKPGHEMIYSTCSILEEENENNIRKLLEEEKVDVIPIDKNTFKGLKLLTSKIEGTMLIAPDKMYEGFFIAKLRKK